MSSQLHPHRHLHRHARAGHHAHAHHRKRFAFSHKGLDQLHDEHILDQALAKPTAGRYKLRDSHLGAKSGDSMTSEASAEAVAHRQKMSQLYTSLYAQQISSTGQLESGMVWVRPAENNAQSVAEILAANSALPSERQK